MLAEYNFREPLADYPWKDELERLISWSKYKSTNHQAFMFDLTMSLAYVDSTRGIEGDFEFCESCPGGYNGHLGFINLCSPCYERKNKWQYQKAAKPSSGALGKMSSEIILKFVEILRNDIIDTFAIGGTEIADAYLKMEDGTEVFAEVKSAPLLTYPVLVKFDQYDFENHKKHNLSTSQFKMLDSAIYMHDEQYIRSGKVNSTNWPFKQVMEFFMNASNALTDSYVRTWVKAKSAYKNKDKKSKYYYLTNASGNPPRLAKDEFDWPRKQSISDSKTSAGIDRTDDIKKGIYQTMKIGSKYFDNPNVKTALISNLPGYRHGKEYIEPFLGAVWGKERDFVSKNGKKYILEENTRRVFDFFITLGE